MDQITENRMVLSIVGIFKEFKLFLFGFLALIDLDKEILFAWALAMLSDTIFAIIANIVVVLKNSSDVEIKKKYRFSGKKLVIGFLSKLALVMAVLVFASMANLLKLEYVFIMNFAIWIFIGQESYSTIGHIYFMRTGKKLRDRDIVSEVIIQVRQGILEKILVNVKKYIGNNGSNSNTEEGSNKGK